MEPTRSQGTSQSHHDHETKPAGMCPECARRFGVIVTSTNQIAGHLDGDYAEAATGVQLIWTLNKHLSRIADALEKIAGGAA